MRIDKGRRDQAAGRVPGRAKVARAGIVLGLDAGNVGTGDADAPQAGVAGQTGVGDEPGLGHGGLGRAHVGLSYQPS